MSVIDRLYKLQPYGRENDFHYVVLLPEPLSFEVVIAAWAYAGAKPRKVFLILSWV